ncbi:MAG TPA: hypothetical protein VK465_19050 [Fibrobacteria bacterium]|nr:hypothetical protein [Fibrobacteria bacterium]
MSYFDIRKLLLIVGLGALGPWGTAWSRGAASTASATAPKSQPTSKASLASLDTSAVRKLYLDGDFDLAIDQLEMALKYDSTFSHQDSVFSFKHLGVMHAAKYETREKGKLYMHKLLEVEPTARILDMYASDMIYMIFKNIQDEYHSMNPVVAFDPEPRPELPPARETIKESVKEPSKRKSLAWVGWTTGALAAAGGIVLGYHMLKDDQPTLGRKENLIDE